MWETCNRHPKRNKNKFNDLNGYLDLSIWSINAASLRNSARCSCVVHHCTQHLLRLSLGKLIGSSTQHYTTHPPTLVSLQSNSRHMSAGSIGFTSGFSILQFRSKAGTCKFGANIIYTRYDASLIWMFSGARYVNVYPQVSSIPAFIFEIFSHKRHNNGHIQRYKHRDRQYKT